MKKLKLALSVLGLLLGSILLQIPITLAIFFEVNPAWLRLPLFLGLSLLIGWLLFLLRKDLKVHVQADQSKRFSLTKIVLLTTGLLGLEILINAVLIHIFHLDLSGSNETIQSALYSENFLPMFLSLVCTAPILEEILFRGLFLEYLLQQYPKHAQLSVLLTAFLFGFAHTYSFLSVQTYLLMLTGLLFSYLYWKNRDLKSSIIAHSLYNLLLALLNFLWG